MGISTTTCFAWTNTAVGEIFLLVNLHSFDMNYADTDEVDEVAGAALAIAQRAAHIKTENFMITEVILSSLSSGFSGPL